jgi:hypothetical protein
MENVSSSSDDDDEDEHEDKDEVELSQLLLRRRFNTGASVETILSMIVSV